jgi:hypothetical protein
MTADKGSAFTRPPGHTPQLPPKDFFRPRDRFRPRFLYYLTENEDHAGAEAKTFIPDKQIKTQTCNCRSNTTGKQKGKNT